MPIPKSRRPQRQYVMHDRRLHGPLYGVRYVTTPATTARLRSPTAPRALGPSPARPPAAVSGTPVSGKFEEYLSAFVREKLSLHTPHALVVEASLMRMS